MDLRYATVTGVARDDLADEGAWLYAETVRQIHALNPDTGVELLIPDFSGDPALLAAGVRLAAPRCWRTTSRPCRASSAASAPASATSGRWTSSPPPATPVWSPSRTSSSASARSRTRFWRPSTSWSPPAVSCSRSPSTCGPANGTTRSPDGSRPRSSTGSGQQASTGASSAVMSGPLVRSSYRAGRLYQQAVDARQANRLSRPTRRPRRP